jgi:hypothetical protein
MKKEETSTMSTLPTFIETEMSVITCRLAGVGLGLGCRLEATGSGCRVDGVGWTVESFGGGATGSSWAGAITSGSSPLRARKVLE